MMTLIVSQDGFRQPNQSEVSEQATPTAPDKLHPKAQIYLKTFILISGLLGNVFSAHIDKLTNTLWLSNKAFDIYFVNHHFSHEY